jgi:predicted secreted protein
MALSSRPLALAELLPLSLRGRDPKGDVWLGDPDRPRVEMDMRRRWLAWALAAAAAMGPWKVADDELLGDRPKMPANVWPGANDARRCVGDGGVGGELSCDIALVQVPLRE